MNARSVWYLALIAIVPGHIFAVYVAHVMALRLYGTSGAALLEPNADGRLDGRLHRDQPMDPVATGPQLKFSPYRSPRGNPCRKRVSPAAPWDVWFPIGAEYLLK